MSARSRSRRRSCAERVTLHLERCHGKTTVWVDGCRVDNDSLGTPHVYDLTAYAAPGRHRLVIAVDNRMIHPVGANAHSVSDHTQTAWNGIIGRMELRATEPVWIDDVQVYPDLAKQSARVRITVGNMTGAGGAEAAEGQRAGGRGRDHRGEADGGGSDPPHGRRRRALGRVSSGAASPFGEPGQRRKRGGHVRHARDRGRRNAVHHQRPPDLPARHARMRDLSDGYPPTDVDEWRRIIRTCKSNGLNHIRFHWWIPMRRSPRPTNLASTWSPKRTCGPR